VPHDNDESILMADPSHRHCRRCGTVLTSGQNDPHPSFQIVRCVRCLYRNVLGCSEIGVPFSSSLANLGLRDHAATLLADARAAGDARPAIADALRLLLAKARDLVDANQEEIAGGLWRMVDSTDAILRIGGAERLGQDSARSASAKASAIVYEILARHGVPEIENRRDSTGMLETEIWPLVTDAGIFGYHSRSLMRGEWTARVNGDAIALTPTSLYLELSEFRINRFHEEEGEGPLLRPDLDAIFDEALIAARGYSWQEVLTLMGDIITGVQRYLQPDTPVTVMWPMQDRLDEKQRRILEDLTLTPERVRRFSEPFYFDCGDESTTDAHDAETSLRLAVHAWSSYYPAFTVRRKGHVHYLLPFQLTDIALTNIRAFKSRLLTRFFEQARVTARLTTSPAAREKERVLNAVRRRVNRLAESRVAAALTGDGWTALSSQVIADPDDATRTEEIDLLAARRIGGRLVILVGEVKDFDTGVHRVAAPRNFASRIEGAIVQLRRKSAFVNGFWLRILKRLNFTADGGPVDLLAILVQTEPLPLAWCGGCAVVFESELPGLAARLADVDLARLTMRDGWQTIR
jgi:hypothetical protein